MYERKIKPEKYDQYINTLSKTELFANLHEEQLKETLHLMSEVSIAGDEILIREGEDDQSLYILLYGRLQVTKSGRKFPLSVITPGGVIGEMSLLTGQKRTASVCAMRHCLLLKLDYEGYKAFEERYPVPILSLAKNSISRLSSSFHQDKAEKNVRILAVAPAGNSDHREFVEVLEEKLGEKAPTIAIDYYGCISHFQEEFVESELITSNSYRLYGWIKTLEQEYYYIILIADIELTPWTQWCLRESDQILYIADRQCAPTLNSIELFYNEYDSRDQKQSDLIFIHPEETVKIYDTSIWKKERSVTSHYHIKLNDKEDLARLIRVLSEETIGIVFNGGGARGYAHVGALQALIEEKIPIDYVAGTSMGAFVSCMYSFEGLEVLKQHLQYFGDTYRGDLTFPFISLYKCKRLTKFFKEWFDDTEIEDLWIPFFCTSCNLSKGELDVHESGSIWKAIRKSTAIPAIFPPIYENGEIIVDGGILDNMPVDIMRERMKAAKIIAINCCSDKKKGKSLYYKSPYISGWELLMKSLLKKRITKKKYDNIVDIILTSIKLASSSYQEEMCRNADYLVELNTAKYGLLDFHLVEEIREEGYKQTKFLLQKEETLRGLGTLKK